MNKLNENPLNKEINEIIKKINELVDDANGRAMRAARARAGKNK